MIISKMAIIVGGFLSLCLFCFHAGFYKLFDWQNEFVKLNDLNQKVLYSVHVALTLLFLFFSVLSFAYFKEMAKCEGLALGVCLGYSLFWLWRLVWQFVYFNNKSSIVSYCLIFSFSLLCLAYLIPVLFKASQ